MGANNAAKACSFVVSAAMMLRVVVQRSVTTIARKLRCAGEYAWEFANGL